VLDSGSVGDSGASDGGVGDAGGVDGGSVTDGSVPDGARPDGSFDGGPDAGPGSCPFGLAAWYRFEDTSGPVVDACGAHDGRVEGSGTTRGVEGRDGLAIGFGGTDGRVVVPASSGLDFITAGTIELWVSVSTSGVGSTVSRGTGSSDDNVLQNTSCWNMQTIYSRSSSGTTNVTSDCDALPVGAFAHVAVVNDGVEARMYVDGVLVRTAPGGYLGPLSTDLYIGRRQQGIFPFAGVIDELKWWTIARTPAEICRDAGGTVSMTACLL
jgi:hypothetical protein